MAVYYTTDDPKARRSQYRKKRNKMQQLHLVMMENGQQDFKYFLGVFTTGAKASAAAEYELSRRRAEALPGWITPRITKIALDEICSSLSVKALEDLKYTNFVK
jgi:hypothetical protein